MVIRAEVSSTPLIIRTMLQDHDQIRHSLSAPEPQPQISPCCDARHACCSAGGSVFHCIHCPITHNREAGSLRGMVFKVYQEMYWFRVGMPRRVVRLYRAQKMSSVSRRSNRVSCLQLTIRFGGKMCEWLRSRRRWLARLMLLATIPFLAGSATPNSIDTGELHTGTDSQWVAACCYEEQYVSGGENQSNEPQEPTSWTLSEILFLALIAGLIFLLGRITAPSGRPSTDEIDKAISSFFDARREEAFHHDGSAKLREVLTAAETHVKKKLEDLKLL